MLKSRVECLRKGGKCKRKIERTRVKYVRKSWKKRSKTGGTSPSTKNISVGENGSYYVLTLGILLKNDNHSLNVKIVVLNEKKIRF